MASQRIINSSLKLSSRSTSNAISHSSLSVLPLPLPLASRSLSTSITTHSESSSSTSSSSSPSTSTSTSTSGSSKPKQGILTSLLHGSQTAQADGLTTKSHSQAVARGKYIHEIQRHQVHPSKVAEYKSLLAQHYPALVSETQGQPGQAKLTGSWEVTIGDLETFYHIWQYDGYSGYDSHRSLNSKSSQILDEALRPLISSRSNWITQEFAFWPTSKPKITNGLYELRTYHLKPGHLLEWEQHWRRGLEARRRFVEPIGAWFTQIGGLHTVFHIWQYPSLEERKKTRDRAWEVDTWSGTVSETVKLIDKMHAQIMKPLDFSPLK